jgi:hypothetical protein
VTGLNGSGVVVSIDSEYSTSLGAHMAKATAGLAERNATIEALTGQIDVLKQQLTAVPPERPLGQREADSLRKLIIAMAMGG